MSIERNTNYVIAVFAGCILLSLGLFALFFPVTSTKAILAISVGFLAPFSRLVWEEQKISITENEVHLQYWGFRKPKTLIWANISRALYRYPFGGRDYNWQLCQEYNNCQSLGARMFFSRKEQRAISNALLKALETNGIQVQGNTSGLA